VSELSSDLASLKINRTPAQTGAGVGKWVLALAALGLLGGGLAYAYPALEAQMFKADVRTASVLDVAPSSAATALTATGYVVAQRRSKVGSSLPGRIAKLHVREGQLVRAGDQLVELDAADHRSTVSAAQARVLAAQARVASAEAQLAELEVQLTRQKALLEQKAAARSVVEDLVARVGTARAGVKAAAAEVRAAEAQLAVSKVNLGRTAIVAPIDGTVLTKPLDVGETLDTVMPVLELADLASLLVEVDVPETRLGLVKLEGPAEIALDAFGAKRFRGRVVELGKRINRAKATATVKVAFAEADTGALPDMSARVSFLTEALSEQALAAPSKRVIPAAAVVKRGGRDVVFVVDSGKVAQRPVSLGATSAEGVELVEGPEVGARVVLAPPDTLADGQRVREGSDG
jgi:HlyD family secretion protein